MTQIYLIQFIHINKNNNYVQFSLFFFFFFFESYAGISQLDRSGSKIVSAGVRFNQITVLISHIKGKHSQNLKYVCCSRCLQTEHFDARFIKIRQEMRKLLEFLAFVIVNMSAAILNI